MLTIKLQKLTVSESTCVGVILRGKQTLPATRVHGQHRVVDFFHLFEVRRVVQVVREGFEFEVQRTEFCQECISRAPRGTPRCTAERENSVKKGYLNLILLKNLRFQIDGRMRNARLGIERGQQLVSEFFGPNKWYDIKGVPINSNRCGAAYLSKNNLSCESSQAESNPPRCRMVVSKVDAPQSYNRILIIQPRLSLFTVCTAVHPVRYRRKQIIKLVPYQSLRSLAPIHGLDRRALAGP